MSNQWALITGATAGIGYELAKCFAANRFDLVLVARNEKRLQEIGGELKARHGVEATSLPRDLAQPEAAANIFDAVRDRPISVLVNNAGFGCYGPFQEQDLALQTEIMQVNMNALVQLTHLFLKPMLARHSGRILNVASTAAFQPGPTMNIYYASKAFVYSFSYALAEELAGTGVTITALCPGLTRTEFQARARLKPVGHWPAMDARTVAEAGFRGVMKGKRVVIPGMANKVASFFAKRVPARLTTAIVRRVHARAG
jgi:short-subunit dehydrogenase